MKKFVLLFYVTLMCCIFCSCRQSETYDFLNSTDEISEVSIVTLSFDENGEMLQEELCKLEDINAFLEDFKNVDCYIWFGDPTGITEEGKDAIVIKILYQNGEYELINWNGQADYKLEQGFRYYHGYSIFDENQFKSLITKYAGDLGLE